MPSPPLPADLPHTLDAMHLKVRDAFARADLADYGRYLASELRYVDARGRVQTREQLLRSVGVQFARLVSFHSAFSRETLLMNGEDAVERGTQDASISLRVFLWFEVRWQVARRGRHMAPGDRSPVAAPRSGPRDGGHTSRWFRLRRTELRTGKCRRRCAPRKIGHLERLEQQRMHPTAPTDSVSVGGVRPHRDLSVVAARRRYRPRPNDEVRIAGTSEDHT